MSAKARRGGVAAPPGEEADARPARGDRLGNRLRLGLAGTETRVSARGVAGPLLST
ncbi:hypothetical protein [Trinickia terrae]|uniref:hypothetical protein n=1 Tax=Trinickia terrae TaxID=2571161 RepID=UPI00146CE03B|nr:hypothetical protein [Trinickia terrae]